MRELLILLAALMLASAAAQENKRRITPLNNAATQTQAVNETATDTAHINARRRAQSVQYTDDRGRIMYIDTITGTEWTDSTALRQVPKMEFPLLHALTAGINLWDPAMRAFGQDYGIASAWAEISLHNRYAPFIELGLGQASHRGPSNNFLYRSPTSVFFRIGANYNFLFNSNPDYVLYAGVRYGFAPFSFTVNDIVLDSPYWQESTRFDIPSQRGHAGWFEAGLGLRVKIWGPISAGWEVRYHSILHQSRWKYGEPWYIPGYGTRSGALTGSFSVSYTLSLPHLNKAATRAVIQENNEVEGLLPPP